MSVTYVYTNKNILSEIKVTNILTNYIVCF